MNDDKSNYWIYGHRGASGLLPENTLEAFGLALKQGADAIETDVRRTKDGHFVLAHDECGQRMCSEARQLRLSSLSEIQAWNAGAGFVGSTSGHSLGASGFRIPLLEEALEEFPTVRFNVDVKDPDIGPFLPQLIQTIRRAGAEKRVLLTSFRWQTVRNVQRIGYSGEVGVGVPAILLLKSLPHFLLPGGVRLGDRVQIPPAWGRIRLDTPEFIKKCHRLGLKVDYWVVNRGEDAIRLVELGADGIMSDFPGTIRTALTKRD